MIRRAHSPMTIQGRPMGWLLLDGSIPPALHHSLLVSIDRGWGQRVGRNAIKKVMKDKGETWNWKKIALWETSARFIPFGFLFRSRFRFLVSSPFPSPLLQYYLSFLLLYSHISSCGWYWILNKFKAHERRKDVCSPSSLDLILSPFSLALLIPLFGYLPKSLVC